MSKAKKLIRPIEKSISIPEDLCGKVDILLYSELEQKVPFGAWAKLVTRLLNEWLEKKKTFTERKEYWKGRCLAAETFIEYLPELSKLSPNTIFNRRPHAAAAKNNWLKFKDDYNNPEE